MYLAFGFITSAENWPTQWHMGALCPLAPLLSATALSHIKVFLGLHSSKKVESHCFVAK